MMGEPPTTERKISLSHILCRQASANLATCQARVLVVDNGPHGTPSAADLARATAAAGFPTTVLWDRARRVAGARVVLDVQGLKVSTLCYLLGCGLGEGRGRCGSLMLVSTQALVHYYCLWQQILRDMSCLENSTCLALFSLSCGRRDDAFAPVPHEVQVRDHHIYI